MKHRILPLVLLLALSCASGPAPITAGVDLAGWAVFDGQVFVGSGTGRAVVRGKVTGAPIYAIELPGSGLVVAARSDGSARVEVPVGEPLPAWAAQPFAPGEAEAHGVSFE